MTNPLVAPQHNSTTSFSGVGLVEDAAQVAGGIHNHSWVDGALGGVGAGLDLLGAVVDPLGSLVSWGVAWLMEHVKPLKEALDWLAGNPDAVAAHAATWQNVSTFTAGASAQYATAIDHDTASWRGGSGDAYRQQAGGQVTVLQGISQAAHGIAYAVEGAGLLVGLVRGIVRDLIAQFVATLAARLPQWLAEEGLTLGLGTPLVIGQVAALVAKWVEKIQHFIRGLLNSLRKLTPMVGKLGRILEDLKAELARLLRAGPADPPPSGPPPTGPLPTGPLPTGPLPTGPLPAGPLPAGSVPPPRSGKHLPADAKLGRQLRGEDDPKNPGRAFYPGTVHYMSPAEREEHRLFVDAEGRLRSASDGRLYDTSDGVTAWSGSGRAIFVMDGSGNLYATLDQRVGRIHHSSLLAGAPVAGAGEIEVQDGRLVAMTNRSGHYRPTAEMNNRVLWSLREQGLTTDPGFGPDRWEDGEG